MRLRALFVAALFVVAGCKDDSGGGAGAGAASGGTGGSGGAAGAMGGSSGAGGGGGSGGTAGLGGTGGSGGASGVGGTGGGGQGGGGTGGGGTGGGGQGGMGGSGAGGGGGMPDPCEDALTPDQKCAVCEDDATCDAATYTDNGDGTVTSSCCGLVWQQDVGDDQFTWQGAQDHCAALALAGSGWRLPNKDELLSLVAKDVMPPIDPVAFPDAPTGTFWTSTPMRTSANRAWSVGFLDSVPGYADTNEVNTTVRARCVR